jgi:hypothetical protein
MIVCRMIGAGVAERVSGAGPGRPDPVRPGRLAGWDVILVQITAGEPELAVGEPGRYGTTLDRCS